MKNSTSLDFGNHIRECGSSAEQSIVISVCEVHTVFRFFLCRSSESFSGTFLVLLLIISKPFPERNQARLFSLKPASPNGPVFTSNFSVLSSEAPQSFITHHISSFKGCLLLALTSKITAIWMLQRFISAYSVALLYSSVLSADGSKLSQLF